MIARITIGYSYRIDGRKCVVVEVLEATMGRSKMVVVKYEEGDRQTFRAGTFRRGADKL